MTRRVVPIVGGGWLTVDDAPEPGRAIVRVWSRTFKFLGYQVRDRR